MIETMIELAERTDSRRITEQDPDYQRLHGHWRRKLLVSVRQYARELQHAAPEHEQAIQGAFVRRQTRLLAQCYREAHAEGQRDYWAAVSLKRHTPHAPDHGIVLRRLRFYTPSIAKMAIEGMAAWHETKRKRTHGVLSEITLTDTSSLEAWLAGIDNRVTLQAEATWLGLQDGYTNESGVDPASPYAVLYWDLEPGAQQHCHDCPQVAGGSPYDPPGSGGNELQQTPGDGQTECGAGCKCSLRYGYFDGHRDIGGMKVPPPSPGEPLNDGQKAALDLMRATSDAWAEHAPDLPELPALFGDTPADMPALDPQTLTPKQRQLYGQWLEAIRQWQTATAPEAVVTEQPPLERLTREANPAIENLKQLARDYTAAQEELGKASSAENEAMNKERAAGRYSYPSAEYYPFRKALDDATARYDEIKQRYRDALAAHEHVQVTESILENGQEVGISLHPRALLGEQADRLKDLLDYQNERETAPVSKRRISQEIAARLEGNPDFARLMEKLNVDSPEKAVGKIVKQWAIGKGPLLTSMQLAIRDEFNLTDSSVWFNDRAIALANQKYGDVQEGLRAVARAMYDNTQAWFSENGITEIPLYRGLMWYEGQQPGNVLFDQTMRVEAFGLSPASAFSVNPTTAAQFASNGLSWAKGAEAAGEYHLAVAGYIPVENILSTAWTGFGSKGESEIVVLGGTYDMWTYAIKTNDWSAIGSNDMLNLLSEDPWRPNGPRKMPQES